MEITKDSFVKNLISANHEVAGIFKNYGFDFCSIEQLSIEDSCKREKYDDSIMNKLIVELRTIKSHSYSNDKIDFSFWTLDSMIEYIEKEHHQFVKKQTPILRDCLEKIEPVHSRLYGELSEISIISKEIIGHSLSYIKKKELLLFPHINNMLRLESSNEVLETPIFKSIKDFVNQTNTERNLLLEYFKQVAELSDEYTTPYKVCLNYELAFSILKKFEEKIRCQKNLEINFLFKKAIELEKEIFK